MGGERERETDTDQTERQRPWGKKERGILDVTAVERQLPKRVPVAWPGLRAREGGGREGLVLERRWFESGGGSESLWPCLV